MSAQKIGFGGGCHWCTEAVFQSLRGVTEVEQGFIKSHAPHDRYSEAVVVTYHPAYLLRSPAQKSKSWADLLMALDVLEEQAR